MTKDTINNIIRRLSEDMLTSMQEALAYVNLQKSNLYKDLETRAAYTNDNIVVELLTNSYIKFADEGRGPTNVPPIDKTNWIPKLIDWAKRNGIPSDNKTIWAIKKKIDKEGYEGKHFIKIYHETLDQKLETTMTMIYEELLKDLELWFTTT